jgi:hypothetical protein
MVHTGPVSDVVPVDILSALTHRPYNNSVLIAPDGEDGAGPGGIEARRAAWDWADGTWSGRTGTRPAMRMMTVASRPDGYGRAATGRTALGRAGSTGPGRWHGAGR